VIERALPIALKLPARDEHHVGVLEARHVAAEIAAVPRRFHVRDHLPDRRFLGGPIVRRRPTAGSEQQQKQAGGKVPHAFFFAGRSALSKPKPSAGISGGLRLERKHA